MTTQQPTRPGDATTAGEENVRRVEEAFDAMNAGDPTKFVDLLDDDFTVAAWTLHGGGQRLLSKADYLAAFAVVAKLDDVKTELVSSEAIGADIVNATVRCYRRLGDLVGDTNIVMGFRFRGPKVLRMIELCSGDFEAFWDASGIEE